MEAETPGVLPGPWVRITQTEGETREEALRRSFGDRPAPKFLIVRRIVRPKHSG